MEQNKKMLVDFHMHSNCSDGSMDVAELVKAVAQRGIKHFSLTDHDTFAGVKQAQELAAQYQIRFISGIELSTSFQGHLCHLLAYYIDPADLEFNNLLASMRARRQERNIKIIEMLQGQGIEIEQSHLSQFSGVVGRVHIAKLLIELGVVRSIPAAFEKYLAKGKLADPGMASFDTAEAIKAVKAAGGLSFLAHPVTLRQNLVSLTKIISELKNCGLDGIEIYNSAHNKRDENKFLKISTDLNLLKSGGSDYHGAIKPHVSLGKAAGRDLFAHNLSQELIS